MGEIAQDTQMVVYGLRDTMACVEEGAVKDLIIWEDLQAHRLEYKNPSTGSTVVKWIS